MTTEVKHARELPKSERSYYGRQFLRLIRDGLINDNYAIIVRDTDRGQWWMKGVMPDEVSTTYADLRDNAGIWRATFYRANSDTHLIEVFSLKDSKELMSLGPKGTYKVDQILSKALITSLKNYPKNEVFRTQFLAVVKEPIPAELQTWKEIVTWLEANYPFKVDQSNPAIADGITLAVHGSCEVGGKCDYQGTEYRNITGKVSSEVLRDLAIDSDDFDDFCYKVRNWMDNNITNTPTYEVESTSHHGVDDAGEPDISFSDHREAVYLLTNWLKTNATAIADNWDL